MNIKSMADAYLATLLRTSLVGDAGVQYADAFEPTESLVADCRAAVVAFLESAEYHITAATLIKEGYTPEDAMRDFVLTRNGRGLPFLSRGLGETGETLDDIAWRFGLHEVYLGDDNLIHGF